MRAHPYPPPRDNKHVTSAEDQSWPLETLNALRLGQPLTAEVPSRRTGLRSFVRVTPRRDDEDKQAAREHWRRADPNRRFIVSHTEYREELLETMDHDVGAVQHGRAEVSGEEALSAQLRAWGVRPSDLTYPWNTDDPT
jgi:hypothetical protein